MTGGVIQKLSSGGIWGIESDSDHGYVEQDELSELGKQLLAIGFSHRAISIALKNVERIYLD